MSLKKIIKIGSFEIEEKICVVDFIVKYDLDCFVKGCEITHSKLYDLLDTATDVKFKDEKISFKQGIINFEATKKTRSK